ncbi:MAG: glycerol kinase GlpK [Syntrophales bacterium]|nr:glycerol kinase GlpK [Syntrophales bacterium]HOG06686.1 glycerol kinase GlpK [Syntrophales bacterium]HOS78078.1 glycerol kinase GlpK [Syntrophales bacterium]HPB71038.1 glycerol kinase GlpK [Syntrophales bacterium]HQN25784.1 glycerol kinase GlpK [Syntrophales bacterium]
MRYILALDQGTTSSRAILFDRAGAVRAVAQKEFRQIYPKPGWVEHDPTEIWATQIGVAAEAMTTAGISGADIAAIGITNQRETTVLWDRRTGQPVYNAIVWQDRRTADLCDALKAEGLTAVFRRKTGLIIDAYFSGTKIRWILDHVPGARARAEAGELAFGTIDTWLVWNLTRGARHVTDASNASRTLLYNIHTGAWDDDLLRMLDIPRAVLPEVRASSDAVGETAPSVLPGGIPIAGIAGDQQAALFGQMCTEPGLVKNTYGTGCFMLMNTGDKPILSENNLLTTVAWKIGSEIRYALEGSVFMGGAVVQWLRDGLGIIRTSAAVEELANRVPDNGGVYLVPAFAGLGAPYWDPYARGTLVGLTRGSGASHIARAALESIAYQSLDVLECMATDAGIDIRELRVDGGATANDTLMQFQADILGVPVIRPVIAETTAMGAACLAGLAVGYWRDLAELNGRLQVDRRFEPAMDRARAGALVREWRRALERSRRWIEK